MAIYESQLEAIVVPLGPNMAIFDGQIEVATVLAVTRHDHF